MCLQRKRCLGQHSVERAPSIALERNSSRGTKHHGNSRGSYFRNLRVCAKKAVGGKARSRALVPHSAAKQQPGYKTPWHFAWKLFSGLKRVCKESGARGCTIEGARATLWSEATAGVQNRLGIRVEVVFWIEACQQRMRCEGQHDRGRSCHT